MLKYIATTAFALALSATAFSPSFAETQSMPMMGCPMMGQGMMGQGMRGQGMMGQGMMGRGMGMMGQGPGMRVMMILMDTDGDGALSLEEVQTAHAKIFKKVDADGNGKATAEEIQTFFRGGSSTSDQ